MVLECDDYKIELLEEYPCNNKEQLLKKEGEYIRNNECCNKYIPDRTRKEYKKQYTKINEEKIKEKNKQYKEANKEEIKEKNKQYKEANKEEIRRKTRENYHKKKKYLIN